MKDKCQEEKRNLISGNTYKSQSLRLQNQQSGQNKEESFKRVIKKFFFHFSLGIKKKKKKKAWTYITAEEENGIKKKNLLQKRHHNFQQSFIGRVQKNNELRVRQILSRTALYYLGQVFSELVTGSCINPAQD